MSIARSAAGDCEACGPLARFHEGVKTMTCKMRAKLQVATVTRHNGECETVRFHAVAANNYPADGADEDNSYAKFSPSATLDITIANPALLGQLNPGEKYYVDFTPAS
jgi:hypothetical protein